MRSVSAGAARWVAAASYLKKWIVLGVVIGAVAGCGAIVFYEALVAQHPLLLGGAGRLPRTHPDRRGRPGASASAARPWALPLVAGAGALLGAVLVFRIAPEAEGHGTDAAISAVHHNPRGVRFRAVIVKIVASALTIGSGGSGGREGPTGQISAGFGSLLARVLDLEPADGRIAVATGIGSGIGAIFGAPLGGAVLASEILYRDDFEPAALLPCFIASAVSYVIFGAVEGYKPLFGFVGSYHFSDPSQLIWFALIGVLAGLVGLLYAKSFYGMADLFHRSPLPRWVNPAIGGLLVGAIGIAIPEVIGTGYGWVQTSLGHGLLSIPLWIVLLLPFARIFATGLSIGSGGSGGIFGPGMVIGAFLGASVWRLFEPVFPSMGHSPGPLCDRRHDGLLRRDLPGTVGRDAHGGRNDREPVHPDPGHGGGRHLVAHRPAQRRHHLPEPAQEPGRRTGSADPRRPPPSRRHSHHPRHGRSTLDHQLGHGDRRARRGRWNTPTSTARLLSMKPSASPERWHDQRSPLADRRALTDLVDAGAPVVSASSRLDVALESLTEAPLSWVPVLDDDRRVVGTLSVSDIVRAYRQELAGSAERMSGLGAGAGVSLVTINCDSPCPARPCGSRLPKGLLITSVTRGDRDLRPQRRHRLTEGDQLSVLGQSSAWETSATLSHSLRRPA